MKSSALLSFLAAVCAAMSFSITDSSAQPRDTAKGDSVVADSTTVALLNKMIVVLQIPDDEKRLSEFLPLVHRDLLTPDGSDLLPSTKDYSYKKASNAAGLYKSPVEITRIRESSVTQIGWKETAETGLLVSFFIAKRDGIEGMPAPVKLFFPADGGPARIYSVGSL